MGLILDSSALIAVERQGKNARQVLLAVSTRSGETEVGISVVTLIEMAHGAVRAGSPERKAEREQFIEELLVGIPISRSQRQLLSALARLMARTSLEDSKSRSLIC